MKDIDGFAVAEAPDLKPILDAFEGMSWPASADATRAFAGDLGWTMKRTFAAETTIPVSWRQANLVVPNDQWEEVKFSITDSLPLDVADDDPVGQATVKAAYASTRDSLRELLGDSVGSRGGKFASEWWDLPSGCRVSLVRIPASVLLKLLSPSAADLERDEARLGISRDRV
jgi:hypothetical protein